MASSDLTPSHVYEQPFPAFDINSIETPAYVVDVALLRKNMEKLAAVQSESGAKVLLALKGFSMFSVFPIMRESLSGCCASGLNEALLAQEFGKEVHVYAPAFKEAEMRQIIPIAHHLSFNSLAQFRKFKPMLDAAKAVGHAPSPGIRVNPEHSEVEVSLYDPCSPGCRLGIRAEALEGEDLTGVEGLHFHALCEQDSDVLERTVAAVEARFPRLLEQVQWVNMGGGHHITRKDYDVERLIRVLRIFRERWGKEVYIEPGEAAGLNTGYLIAEVQDIVGARKTPVAISQPQTTIHHVQAPADSFSYRTPGDARSLARELYRRLQDDARRNDCADAAERVRAETESILAWAQANGCLISPSVFEVRTASFAQLEGGAEHEVLLDQASNRVNKLTTPPNFGARGQALAYLENLLAYDVLLGFEWCFEGVVQEPDGMVFLTSQPFIAAEQASDEQIDAYFSGQGFIKKRENTYFRSIDGITLADARPANMLRDEKGSIFPIDIHILGVNAEDLLDEVESSQAACDVLPTAILDLSATAHMPDCLEMPYRPRIFGAGLPGEFPHEYKMGGMSCLAGDVLAGFSFPEPLQVGQRLVFADMAHYTMVKTTTFNGVPHPDIAIYDPATKDYRVVRRFGYADFKNKLS
jgi:carboxynorspermidine decarboxylase